MKVKINSLHFKTDQKLDLFIENKVVKLYKLSENITSSEVTLKIENDVNNENKVAEIKINLAGTNNVYAKKQSKTFEESVDLAVEALKIQISKHKEKIK